MTRTDATRPSLPAVLGPVATAVVIGSLLTHGGHLTMYVVQFVALAVGFWVADRYVGFSRSTWWLCVGLISVNFAMGAINVGGDEIYNLELGTHLLRLDHPMHLVSAAIVTIACWEALEGVADPRARVGLLLIVMAALAALGLGAIKELSDSITGLDTDPAEVVWSTRWDLVFNTIGAALAVAVLALRVRRHPA